MTKMLLNFDKSREVKIIKMDFFSARCKIFKMATPVRNQPTMHCKPLSIDYVMSAYGLCLFYLILQSGD